MAVPQSRIAELASFIGQETKALDETYSSSGLSPPTFAAEASQTIGLPNDINAIHYRIVEATSELQALLLGPFGIIRNYVHEQTTLIPILAIYRFKIGHHVPDDGQISYHELSRKCGLTVSALQRILRFAMTKHIFHEPEKGYVAHNAPSKVLVQMPFIDDWLGMTCEEMWPSATKVVEALIKWPASEEPNHSGSAIAHSSSGGLFESIRKDASRVERFANAMKFIQIREGCEPHHIVQAFPGLDQAVKVFVDVGGSFGAFSVTLAQHFKDTKFIVQDLPEVTADGPSHVPSELQDRVHFMAHDFFKEQPVKGADVYFFRWIFHTCADKYALKLLQNLIPALKKGARIIISEVVAPSYHELSRGQEWLARTYDMGMLELYNGKERDRDDWAELIEHADSRFVLRGIRKPDGSFLSFIEIVWEGS